MIINNTEKSLSLIANSTDITQLVEKITWSGDTKEVARKLVFSIICKESDYYLPKVEINEGDVVLLQDNWESDSDKILFAGILFDIEKSGSSNTITYTCFDCMFYLNRYEMSKVFDNTPEAITSDICKEIGVTLGYAEPTGIQVYLPAFGFTAYDIITSAYTSASNQNNKKYIPVIKNTNEVHIIEKGIYSGVLLDSTYNIIESNYSSSLQNLVNKVIITNDSCTTINQVDNATSISKYGTIQKVYKSEDGKNAFTEASALIHELDQTADITALSNIKAVSGYSIAVQESISGLYGLFFIESDSHEFTNGKATMQLNLAFENLMDEKEIKEN